MNFPELKKNIALEFIQNFLDTEGDWYKADPLMVKNFLFSSLDLIAEATKEAVIGEEDLEDIKMGRYDPANYALSATMRNIARIEALNRYKQFIEKV